MNKTIAHAVSHEDVAGVVGRIEDGRIAAIIATGATLEDVIEAFAWAEDEGDALAAAEKSLSGRVAKVYEILTADEQWNELER